MSIFVIWGFRAYVERWIIRGCGKLPWIPDTPLNHAH
jgi:hypothetical protein